MNESNDVVRVLAVDVGAGTQDILVYESDRKPENCFKLVLPSQTQIVAGRIRAATEAKRPISLVGHSMGGGASSEAIERHLLAGFPVFATSAAAATIHNRRDRVRAQGVAIDEAPPVEAVEVELGDLDLPALERALSEFDIAMPSNVAAAVQDHGFRPGAGNNDVRFEYLQSLLNSGGSLETMVLRAAPSGMTRMEATLRQCPPGSIVMDTGAAAVLGALGDPVVSQHASDCGAILINVGNMHTFATLIRGDRMYGLFEHHTGGISAGIIDLLVRRLRDGSLDAASFAASFDGHGAAIHPDYFIDGPFDFVAITGPNRSIARDLGYHEAAPFGDMMLTGAFGLVEGYLMTSETTANSGLSLLTR